MMKLRLSSFLFSCCFISLVKSQNYAINIGYDYIGKSAGFTGLEYRIPSKSNVYSNLGIGTYFTTDSKDFIILPEVHYNITSKNGYKAEVSLCAKKVTPSIGINLFNAMHLNLGYNIPFNNNENFKGFYMGLHLFIGKNGFYDSMKLF